MIWKKQLSASSFFTIVDGFWWFSMQKTTDGLKKGVQKSVFSNVSWIGRVLLPTSCFFKNKKKCSCGYQTTSNVTKIAILHSCSPPTITKTVEIESAPLDFILLDFSSITPSEIFRWFQLLTDLQSLGLKGSNESTIDWLNCICLIELFVRLAVTWMDRVGI